ncbi:MAG: hypothetical protein WBI20_01830 [Burkholderiaceae bacterium]
MAFDGFPAPFEFEPREGGSVKGPAFSLSFRLLTFILVAGCSVWGAHLWQQGALGAPESQGGWWLLAALSLLQITAFYIWRSQTSISSSALKQSWIWDKEMAVAELSYAKLIRWPGFDWLIAPRLYVRSMGGKFATFYSADSRVLAEFERLSEQLKKPR